MNIKVKVAIALFIAAVCISLSTFVGCSIYDKVHLVENSEKEFEAYEKVIDKEIEKTMNKARFVRPSEVVNRARFSIIGLDEEYKAKAYIKSINPNLSTYETQLIYRNIKKFSKKGDVELFLGLATVESNFRIRARSYLGETYGKGLMQVSDICRIDYNNWNGTNYTSDDLFNVAINIKIGTWVYYHNSYYFTLHKVKNFDESRLLVAYNEGIGVALKKTNSTYAKKVIKNKNSLISGEA